MSPCKYNWSILHCSPLWSNVFFFFQISLDITMWFQFTKAFHFTCKSILLSLTIKLRCKNHMKKLAFVWEFFFWLNFKDFYWFRFLHYFYFFFVIGFDWLHTWPAGIFNVLDHIGAHLFTNICYFRESGKLNWQYKKCNNAHMQTIKILFIKQKFVYRFQFWLKMKFQM